ncbi:MAG: hypothetical protein ACR2RV_08990, partial [Verrucomicrobiales bacterium]
KWRYTMSEELNPLGDEDGTADKKCKQEKNTARNNFEAVLDCIAKQAKIVNDLRMNFLEGISATPGDLREAEKNLFNAIKVASKGQAKKQFESFVVELKYKEKTYTDPSTGNDAKTEIISAVRGLTFYHEDNDKFALTGEQEGDSEPEGGAEGQPFVPKYSSLSSSSSVNGYA